VWCWVMPLVCEEVGHHACAVAVSTFKNLLEGANHEGETVKECDAEEVIEGRPQGRPWGRWSRRTRGRKPLASCCLLRVTSLLS
jgi:hypothetical protein